MSQEGVEARRAALRVLRAVSKGQPFEQALGKAIGPLGESDKRLAH